METSVLNRTVSVLRSYADLCPKDTNLLTYLTDHSQKAQVLNIRSTQDTDTKKALKAKLPAVHVSGRFQGRGEANLISHSGLICIDIDQKDNAHITDFRALKVQISQMPYVAYCAFSVSGEGLWAIIPISNPRMHKAHFAALQRIFKHNGIHIDGAPSNPASLRGYSYDPEAYFNHQAKAFTTVYEEPVKPKTQYALRPGISSRDSPFDDFNENGKIESVLQAHGWQWLYTKGTKSRYCRPGKNQGVSADYCSERKLFYVFTNESVFQPNQAYNHVQVLSQLECGGDYALCRKLLIQMGY